MNENILMNALAELRLEGSDNQYFEVKTAAGGFPGTAIETICAFANTPGGGVLIFGVDENLDFAIVGVYDSKDCQQVLANYAKKEFSIPVGLKTTLLIVQGKKVVWVEVSEADKTLKPVKIKRGNRAFIRQFDGDYELSEQEEQMFISARGISHFDEEPVPGTDGSELNKDLTASFIQNRKRLSSTLSQMTDDEVLLRSGVITQSGELTKAGLLTLGIYPQQFFPNYTIRASVRKAGKQSTKIRATNVRSFDGPIPTMLEEAISWVSENNDELVLDLPNGKVRNVKEYPAIVMRELIANTLIHRDLSPMAQIQTISLTIEGSRLVLSNPGGLYGLHVNELGRTGSKTRNSRIADICQYVLAADGANVIERLGSGIPKVIAELEELNMPAPRFIDGGIYFTVILNSIASGDLEEINPSESLSGSNENRILIALKGGPKTKNEVEQMTKLTFSQTKYALAKLLKANKVYRIGMDRSPNTKYALVSDE